MSRQRRTDNTTAMHFRSGRYALINGQHYFSTREGTLEGPYSSRGDAESAVAGYIERMQVGDRMQQFSPRHIDNRYSER